MHIKFLAFAEKKRFVKMRNPWVSFEWKGDYLKKFQWKWTESLKKELSYVNEDDGSFWMILDDFINFFSVSFAIRFQDNCVW